MYNINSGAHRKPLSLFWLVIIGLLSLCILMALYDLTLPPIKMVGL